MYPSRTKVLNWNAGRPASGGWATDSARQKGNARSQRSGHPMYPLSTEAVTSTPLSMRFSLLSVLILAACGSPEPVTSQTGTTPLDAVYGRWTFEAERPREQGIRGWFVLAEAPDAHRFVVPNTPLDSVVYESAPSLNGTAFVWDGEIDSAFGRGAFRIEAVVEGDTMRGTNDVPRAGRYAFVAVRAD